MFRALKARYEVQVVVTLLNSSLVSEKRVLNTQKPKAQLKAKQKAPVKKAEGTAKTSFDLNAECSDEPGVQHGDLGAGTGIQ